MTLRVQIWFLKGTNAFSHLATVPLENDAETTFKTYLDSHPYPKFGRYILIGLGQTDLPYVVKYYEVIRPPSNPRYELKLNP